MYMAVLRIQLITYATLTLTHATHMHSTHAQHTQHILSDRSILSHSMHSVVYASDRPSTWCYPHRAHMLLVVYDAYTHTCTHTYTNTQTHAHTQTHIPYTNTQIRTYTRFASCFQPKITNTQHTQNTPPQTHIQTHLHTQKHTSTNTHKNTPPCIPQL